MYEALYIANLFYIMNKTHWSIVDDEFYILPCVWFDKWKIYTNFDYYMSKTSYILGDKQEDKAFFSKTEQFIKEEIIKHFENTFLIGNSQNYPGHINNNSLIYDKSLHLYDEENKASHLNCNIKDNLIDGRDFILISKCIWNFFQQIYGGNEIKRFSMKVTPTESIIETKLKNVYIYIYKLLFIFIYLFI